MEKIFFSTYAILNTCVRVHSKSVSDIEFSDLPQLPDNFTHPQNQVQEINIVHERAQVEPMLHQLHNDQQQIHNTIINAITTISDQNFYFVDGPSGKG